MHSWNGSIIDEYLVTQIFFRDKILCEMARLRGRPRHQLIQAARTKKHRRSGVKRSQPSSQNSQAQTQRGTALRRLK